MCFDDLFMKMHEMTIWFARIFYGSPFVASCITIYINTFMQQQHYLHELILLFEWALH